MKKNSSLPPEERARQSAIELQLIALEAELATLLEGEHYEESEKSFYAFFRYAWKYIDPAPYKDNWHLRAICDHLQAVYEGDIHDLIVNIPPRSAKSSIISVAFPCWLWIKDPTIKLITASYGADLAQRDSVKSRRLIESPWYQKRWKNLFTLAKDQNRKYRYDNDKFGYRLATSVGGVGTGEGFDYLVVDDAMNALEANSELKREEVINWWKGTVSTRANDIATARRIIIAQRLHQDDLPGFLLSQGGWEHLNLPARYEEDYSKTTIIGFHDPRTVEGEPMWKERFPDDKLEQLERELGPYQAAAQLQQRPVPKGGGIFQRKWWKFWYFLPKTFDAVFQSWDFAIDADDLEQTKSSVAYSVGQVWGRVGADNYLIWEERGKWDILGMLDAVERVTKRFPQARQKLIENKANGKPIVKMLQRKISGFVLIEPKDYGGSKVSRANGCIAEVKSGNVFIPHPTLPGYEWMGDEEELKDKNKDSWLNEVTLFPKHKYKDRVDTMTQYLNYVFEANGGSDTIRISPIITDSEKTIAGSREIFSDQPNIRPSSRTLFS